MSILICPVCRTPLQKRDNRCVCQAGHSFDFAKEGYLNLLLSNRHRSRTPGDAPALVQARRAFLDAGYYAPLRARIASLACAETVLDACCGEGYYTTAAAQNAGQTFGFDIAKDAVRSAARRDKQTTYFVAGLHEIPVQDDSVDVLLHLFAPFADSEFCRVLRDGGTLVHVQPGARHLMGLKRVLYDTPYENPETPPPVSLPLERQERLRYTAALRTGEDIRNLFAMTPYVYKTSPAAAERLRALDTLETEIDFVLRIYKKP